MTLIGVYMHRNTLHISIDEADVDGCDRENMLLDTSSTTTIEQRLKSVERCLSSLTTQTLETAKPVKLNQYTMADTYSEPVRDKAPQIQLLIDVDGCMFNATYGIFHHHPERVTDHNGNPISMLSPPASPRLGKNNE
jgi:hypothetical protein